MTQRKMIIKEILSNKLIINQMIQNLRIIKKKTHQNILEK